MSNEVLSAVFFVYVAASTCGICYVFYKLSRFNRDIRFLSELIRTLVRTGKVFPGAKFQSSSIDNIWRKIIAFYGSVTRNLKVKGETEVVISHALDLLKKNENSDHLLKVLTEVLLKACAPDSLFVSIGERVEESSQWFIKVSTGISLARLEDPLLLAIESLPLGDGRRFIYTSDVNGSAFDFSGLGSGLSLFVPMIDSQGVHRVIWIAFKQTVGLLDENRRGTIELIVEHALAMYQATVSSEQTIEKSNIQKEKVLNLSHDLKSPSIRALYALREYKNVSISEPGSGEVLLQEIEFALEEQLGLISELFSAGGSEFASHDSLSPVEFDICSAIQSRIESFSIIARSVNLELRNLTGVRAKVKMPKLIFNRVLDNLMSNAIKYTSTGSIVISSSVVQNNVEICVEDTGSGVREDLVPHLFSSSMKTQQRLTNSGQGYGLAVSKKLVEDWGGEMGYRKGQGGGSLFYFSLPVVSSLKRTISSDLMPVVMLIDDDVTLNRVHARWLQSLGVKVVIAKSFVEAQSMLELVQPKIIITDVNIPGEDFYGFISKIPTIISLLLVTAGDLGFISSSVSGFINIKGILEKPLNKDQLLKLTTEIIENCGDLGVHEKAA